MSQDWVIDVLNDLKKFAHANGLMGLAEQLDDSILVAAAELDGGANGTEVAEPTCTASWSHSSNDWSA